MQRRRTASGTALRTLMHYEDQREMVQIQVNRVIPAPKPLELGNEIKFERGDGVWKLVLHDPEEMRMGVLAWQPKLLRNEDDVSAAHHVLTSSRTAFPSRSTRKGPSSPARPLTRQAIPRPSR